MAATPLDLSITIATTSPHSPLQVLPLSVFRLRRSPSVFVTFSPVFLYVDGDLFSESELLGRACPGFPSSSSFSSCCRCCSSPSSEPELDDRTTGSGSVIDDDGGDGAWGGDHGAVAGEVHSSGAGGDGMRNMGNSTVPLPEEPASSVHRARWNASAYTEVDISRWRQRRTYLELLRSYHDSGSGRLALLAEAKDAILRSAVLFPPSMAPSVCACLLELSHPLGQVHAR